MKHWILAAAVLASAHLAWGCDAMEHAGPPKVGGPAPAYAATTLEGAPISLADMRGQTVLLNVWATWCHPCRAEMPDLEKIHQAYAGRGLKLVGVSIDEAGMKGEMAEFVQEFGVTYAIWHDPAQDVSSTFATVGVPTTFLIGKDGRLLWKHVGPVKADDKELNRLIEQSLAGS